MVKKDMKRWKDNEGKRKGTIEERKKIVYLNIRMK